MSNRCPASPDGKHHRPHTCTCYALALEPDEDCPIHGFADMRRCEYCQRFVKWPKEDGDE